MSRIFDFQSEKWLKSNTGKIYQDAIDVYYKILENKKKGKTKNNYKDITVTKDQILSQ